MEVMGCQHYLREVQAPCCQIYYSCKLCHDDKYMGPKSPGCKQQRMQFEKLQQIPSNQCVSCKVVFGKFACLKCKLYENNQEKASTIFHCDDCGMCRRGKPQQFFHCFNCGYCRSISQKGKHKCTQNIALSKCPICMDVLKYSTKPYHSLKCGHLIHVDCQIQLESLNCPVCGMARVKLSNQQNKHIQNLIQNTKQQLPQQLKDKKVNVICNECLHKTIDANFHFYGVKCQDCGTYNTKMI